MKNRTGLIILIAVCVGLAIALIWNQKQSTNQRHAAAERIEVYSNKLVNVTGTLYQQQQTNLSLADQLKRQRDNFKDLTNAYARVSSNLDQTQTSLKATQQEMAKQLAERDAKISALQSQNQHLDQRALELNTAITNLTAQIKETKRKLAASEGDKAFLEKQLQRLMAEKAKLEKQFNDLAVLRAQVAKLKNEMDISRRLRWIREGLFARSGQKGAELLMQKSHPMAKPAPRKQPNYDLNVEVSADGTVRVIPPLTNNPSATNPPASSATNAPAAQ